MPLPTRRLFAAMFLAWSARGQNDPKDFWNKVYSADHPIFLEQPTALLVHAVKDLHPGKALDIGMGQGRNSIFLANKVGTSPGSTPLTKVSGRPRRKPVNGDCRCTPWSRAKRTLISAQLAGT